MSKTTLRFDDEFEYIAFGISCHQKDFRAAWLLNRSLKLDFIKKDLVLYQKNGVSEYFSKYECRDQKSHLRYVLLSNFNERLYFNKSLKQYDFFVLVEGYIELFDAQTFLETLHRIEGFQFVNSVDRSFFDHVQFDLFEE